jgi:acyl-CoA thioesterase I
MTHRAISTNCKSWYSLADNVQRHFYWRHVWLLCALLIVGLALPRVSIAQQPTVSTVLVYGDSLSAAYGLDPQQGWVHLLAERLKQEKFAWRVVNASISGETTAGGLSRMKRSLSEHRPAIVVLALGANDGLRGLPVATMRANLLTMVTEIRAAGARPVLVGIQLPPNFGAYARDFGQAFGDLAKKENIPLVPFLLEGIADKRDYFLPDNLHPNAKAQLPVLENVWKTLKPQLSRR